MTHVIEPASSGRAKCRGCDQKIAKGELRLGEKLPNPYGEGEMTLWYHPLCGAFKRPDVLVEAAETTTTELEDRETLLAEAQHGLAHRRLPRLNGAQKAPTGRARCRSCKEMISKDTWRFSLVYYEEGRFEPAGYIHVGCAQEYFDTTELMSRVRHFSPGLDESDLEDLQTQLA